MLAGLCQDIRVARKRIKQLKISGQNEKATVSKHRIFFSAQKFKLKREVFSVRKQWQRRHKCWWNCK